MLVKCWSKICQTPVKCWSNAGQKSVKRRSNAGQTLAKYLSNAGQTLVKRWSNNFGPGRRFALRAVGKPGRRVGAELSDPFAEPDERFTPQVLLLVKHRSNAGRMLNADQILVKYW